MRKARAACRWASREGWCNWERVYRLFTSLPGSDREYNRTDFTRDLYLLDRDGPKTTRRGLRVTFPRVLWDTRAARVYSPSWHRMDRS